MSVWFSSSRLNGNVPIFSTSISFSCLYVHVCSTSLSSSSSIRSVCFLFFSIWNQTKEGIKMWMKEQDTYIQAHLSILYHMAIHMQFSISFFMICPSISFISAEFCSRFSLCVVHKKYTNNNNNKTYIVVCFTKTLSLGFLGKFPLWTMTKKQKNKKVHIYANYTFCF